MSKEKSPNVTRVLKTKRNIESDPNLLAFVGSVPKGKDFDTMISNFLVWLPKSVERYVLADSLASLAGQMITQELLSSTAWRLAGNMARLSRGYPAMPWTHQARKEWVPVHITSARKEFSSRGKPLVRYTAVVLAGSPASIKVDKVWPAKFVPIIARHIGFTQLRGDFPYQHIWQFIGLRMRVLFDPELSQSHPVFDKVDDVQPSGVLDWNRMILGWRARRTWVCPEGYQLPQHPCHLCHIGLDKCKAAVHPVTYVVQPCLRCGRQAFHDPAGRSRVCLDCDYKKMLESNGG